MVSGANFLSGSQRIYISSAAWQALSRTLIRRWFLVQTSGAQRIYLVPIKCLVQQLSPGLSSSGGLHALLLLHSLSCTTATLLHAPLSLSYIHYICIAAPFTHSFPTKPSPLLCVADILHVLALAPFFCASLLSGPCCCRMYRSSFSRYFDHKKTALGQF